MTSVFTEGASPVSASGGAAQIADPDDANMELATIVLTNAKIGDVLTLGALPGGIIGDVVSGPGTITVTLTGSASKAAYQTAINGVTFHNTSDTPDTTPRTINVTVNDGALGSNVATSTLTVTAINDVPAFAASTLRRATPKAALPWFSTATRCSATSNSMPPTTTTAQR